MLRVQGSPPWSDLPPELLGLVFLWLPTRADRAFFPAVCRTWCSAARKIRLPPLSPVPWLVLPRGRVTCFPGGETFWLPDGVRYHNSCGEWLLLSRDDGSCFLLNPFTNATMAPYHFPACPRTATTNTLWNSEMIWILTLTPQAYGCTLRMVKRYPYSR
ncbi:hypothetical protein BS78_05G015900 [Paspalum vaginatum]|nr:hypothetical protein BS78_05G015900 [Paspalum vaginatum]